MKTCLVVLFIIIGTIACKPVLKKEKVYYIYNSKTIFRSREVNFDTIHYISYDAERIINVIPQELSHGDKILVTYCLQYHSKWGRYKDTTFVKHKSYLDSIDFYGTEWLKDNNNLAKFWKISGGWPDPLKIYLFEPIPGTDSLIFRRVHRLFDHPED